MKTVRHGLVLAVSGGTGLEPSPHQIAAAVRAGGTGVLDLGAGDPWRLRVLAQTARRVSEGFGVRIEAGCAATPAEIERAGGPAVALIVLTADAGHDVAALAGRYRVLVEVTDLTEARAAQAAGAHGLIARAWSPAAGSAS